MPPAIDHFRDTQIDVPLVPMLVRRCPLVATMTFTIAPTIHTPIPLPAENPRAVRRLSGPGQEGVMVLGAEASVAVGMEWQGNTAMQETYRLEEESRIIATGLGENVTQAGNDDLRR